MSFTVLVPRISLFHSLSSRKHTEMYYGVGEFVRFAFVQSLLVEGK
jgi:hypothetical protein